MLELWLLLEASCCYTYSEYAMKNETKLNSRGETLLSNYLRLQELVTVKVTNINSYCNSSTEKQCTTKDNKEFSRLIFRPETDIQNI